MAEDANGDKIGSWEGDLRGTSGVCPGSVPDTVCLVLTVHQETSPAQRLLSHHARMLLPTKALSAAAQS